MKTISPDQLLAQLNWRYATKQYDPTRRIAATDWAALEQTLLLAPSGFNLQPWRFLVIDDPKVRAELLPVSNGQRQVVDADRLVVLTYKTALNEADVDERQQAMAATRGVSTESLSGWRSFALGAVVNGKAPTERRAWARNQVYIALGSLVTSAALLGIDATPMEGFDPAAYDRILGLEAQGLATAAIVALGYRAPTDRYADVKKARLPRSAVITHV